MTSHNRVTTGRVARERRQSDAAVRRAAHASRSAKQQLALINKRPGKSVREVTRLFPSES